MENSTINEKDQTQAWFFFPQIVHGYTIFRDRSRGERERKKELCKLSYFSRRRRRLRLVCDCPVITVACLALTFNFFFSFFFFFFYGPETMGLIQKKKKKKKKTKTIVFESFSGSDFWNGFTWVGSNNFLTHGCVARVTLFSRETCCWLCRRPLIIIHCRVWVFLKLTAC